MQRGPEIEIQCKMTRKKFRKDVPNRSSCKLDDVCGPMQEETLSGRMYFVTFLDDLTKKMWVYFIPI